MEDLWILLHVCIHAPYLEVPGVEFEVVDGIYAHLDQVQEARLQGSLGLFRADVVFYEFCYEFYLKLG